MPLPTDKVQQFAVQFACRTPVRTDLSPSERKSLENLLRDTNPEAFQLFSDASGRNTPYLFQAARQHAIGAVTVTVPSFILANDSVTLLAPIRLGGQYVAGQGASLETNALNRNMVDILFKIQNAIRSLRFNRAGKIFEFLLGPYQPEDKQRLFGNLIVPSLDLSTVGELDFSFARYTQLDGLSYNIRTDIKYQQLSLGDSFQLGVRVDINNRELRERLDPDEVNRYWSVADQQIWTHLDSILAP
jgi:hypothetical protein